MSKRRGRPRGSSPHKAADDAILKKVAADLAYGRAATPTGAFRKLTDVDADIRRLQRRWKSDGERFVAELRAPWFEQKWALEARNLQSEAPETFARIKAFYESEGGSDILSKLSGVKSPMMSYGLAKLGELVEQTSPNGPAAAERAFAAHYDGWSRFGSAPDAAFLRRFAELCLETAGAASGSDIRGKKRSK